MTKRLIFLLLAVICGLNSFAQADADRILGVYEAQLSNNEAKIKAFKYQDGYRMQIFWLKKPKNDDGTPKVDGKNPDKKRRTTPMTEVVLIDKVTYEDGLWQNGRVYDPTSGKSYKVELKLEGKKLEVKGKWGPFFKRMYWKKIQ